MNDHQKLRLKIGDFEFEAEGPVETVKEQLDTFRAMVEKLPASPSREPDPMSGSGSSGQSKDLTADDLARHFSVDRKRRLVTLRIHPQGAHRDANAILLVLFGFLRLLNEEDVLVGRLKDALEQSGIMPSRIDKAIAPHQRNGLVLRGGKGGPGGKYRLSMTGINAAEGLIRDLT